MGASVGIMSLVMICQETNQLLIDITGYCNNTYSDKNKLYERSKKIIDIILITSDHENKLIGPNLMELYEENVHDKTFCMNYFETLSMNELTQEVNELQQIYFNEQDTNEKWKLYLELT